MRINVWKKQQLFLSYYIVLANEAALSQTKLLAVSHILKQYWKCKYIGLDGLFRPTSKQRRLGRLTKCSYTDKKALHTPVPLYINRNWDLIRVTLRYFRSETTGRVVYSCVSHQRGPTSVSNRKLRGAFALLTSPQLFILPFFIYYYPHAPFAFIVTYLATSAPPSTPNQGSKLISKFQTSTAMKRFYSTATLLSIKVILSTYSRDLRDFKVCFQFKGDFLSNPR